MCVCIPALLYNLGCPVSISEIECTVLPPPSSSQFHKHLTVLTKEQGMDRQNYQCVGCNGQIGLSE